jgi:sugar phosphate isomerase/epimerase
MWAIKNFPTLADFFEAARRMGFARIELNHKVNSAMLAGIDMDKFSFSSVHEPCPADISADELKKRDWLVSSTDEARRIEGVAAIKKSIDMAHHLGADGVVIHAGHTIPDKDGLEKRLRALIDSGHENDEECESIRKEMIALRENIAPKALEAVKKSMLELLEYARQFNICLGIENRYHYLEFPSPDELGILLDLAEPGRLGFIFDSGHARTLARLGFFPETVWLERFAGRVIGTHLHDVTGTTDHFSPGQGEVAFDALAPHLPEKAFRTCEFQSFNSPEQVKAGLEYLAKAGCIKLRDPNGLKDL